MNKPIINAIGLTMIPRGLNCEIAIAIPAIANVKKPKPVAFSLLEISINEFSLNPNILNEFLFIIIVNNICHSIKFSLLHL